MGIRTFTVKTCDRCGQEIDDDVNSNEWGEAQLAWRGHIGARAWNGDAGGSNIEGKVLLCLPCTRLFLDFVKPTTKETT